MLETALTDLLNEGQRGKGKPVLCIVDEMAQLGPHMKSLANVQGMGAGAAGLIMWGILQDLSQLKACSRYMGNLHSKLRRHHVFGARDQTTREYISKLSGTCEC